MQNDHQFRRLALRAALSFLTLCLFLTACERPELASSRGSFAASPGQLTLTPVWVGHARTFTLTLENLARFETTLNLQVGPELSTVAPVTLAAGESRDVELAFSPDREGRTQTFVSVSSDTGTQRISIDAEVQVPPNCLSADECQASTFNVDTGRCETLMKPEGSACGASNQCFTDGRCHAGRCEGLAVTCDDHNACTRDSCAPATGCVFTDASTECAAPSDPCHAAACDPVKGCLTVEVVDGTSCGPRDCSHANVCLSGQCVERQVPEGAACGNASPCQAAGICQNHQCVQPPATSLRPAWSRGVGITGGPGPTVSLEPFFFDGQVDRAGTTYAIIGDRLQAIDAQGVMQWQWPAGAQTLGIRCSACDTCDVENNCDADPYISRTPIWALDEATQTVFLIHLRFLTALDLKTGQVRWSVNFSNTFTKRSYVSEIVTQHLTLLGDAVVLDVIEGVDAHTTWLLGYDRRSGRLSFVSATEGHVVNLVSLQEQVLVANVAPCQGPPADWHTIGPANRLERYDTRGVLLQTITTLGPLSVVTPTLVATQQPVSLSRFDATGAALGAYVPPMSLTTWGPTEALSTGQTTWLFSSQSIGCGVAAVQDLVDTDLILGMLVNGLDTATPVHKATAQLPTAAAQTALMRDGSLLSFESEFGDFGGAPIFAVAHYTTSGERDWACPVPVGPGTFGVNDGQVVLSNGSSLMGLAMPGVQPARTGWSAHAGNQARDRVAR